MSKLHLTKAEDFVCARLLFRPNQHIIHPLHHSSLKITHFRGKVCLKQTEIFCLLWFTIQACYHSPSLYTVCMYTAYIENFVRPRKTLKAGNSFRVVCWFSMRSAGVCSDWLSEYVESSVRLATIVLPILSQGKSVFPGHDLAPQRNCQWKTVLFTAYCMTGKLLFNVRVAVPNWNI